MKILIDDGDEYLAIESKETSKWKLVGDKKSSTTAESELNKGFEDLVVDGGR